MGCRKCGSKELQQNEKWRWLPLWLKLPSVRCADCGLMRRKPFWANFYQAHSPPIVTRKRFKVQRRTDYD